MYIIHSAPAVVMYMSLLQHTPDPLTNPSPIVHAYKGERFQTSLDIDHETATTKHPHYIQCTIGVAPDLHSLNVMCTKLAETF